MRADGLPGTHHQHSQPTADARVRAGVTGVSCSKSARVSQGPALAGGRAGPALVGSAGGWARVVTQGQAGAGSPDAYWRSACSEQALASKTTEMHENTAP